MSLSTTNNNIINCMEDKHHQKNMNQPATAPPVVASSLLRRRVLLMLSCAALLVLLQSSITIGRKGIVIMNENIANNDKNDSRPGGLRATVTKVITNTNNNNNSTTTMTSWPRPERGVNNTWIYWIHVGKTGGISFRDGVTLDNKRKKSILPCLMRETDNENVTVQMAMERCYRHRSRDEPALSRAILSHFHLSSPLFSDKQKQWLRQMSNTFLYNVRSPIARLNSAFYYHKRELLRRGLNRGYLHVFYNECYETMEDMAQAMQVVQNENNATTLSSSYNFANAAMALSDRCRSSTKKAMRSLNHFNMSYNYYLRQTLELQPDHDVVVVRTEHFWNDVRQLDAALNGTGHFIKDDLHFTHLKENEVPMKKKPLSPESSRALCCFIVKDIDAYQRLILQAANLNDADKRETLQLAFDECSISEQERQQHQSGGVDIVMHPFAWKEWKQTSCPELAISEGVVGARRKLSER